MILGAAFAGLVYVVIAIIVKFAGVKWINKIMPAVVIGPTVAIIGLSLAPNAISDLTKGSVTRDIINYVIKDVDGVMTIVEETGSEVVTSPYIALLCGLVTLFVTMISSVYGKKMLKMIPFIIGIVSGYLLATIFTVIGNATGIDALKVINFSAFANMQWYPDFSGTVFRDLEAVYSLGMSLSASS